MTTHKAQLLEERMISFSIAVVKFCSEHTNNRTIRPILDQVLRSSTSIGANYAEANNASSKADFKNKIYIAKKECGETKYWFRILDHVVNDEKIAPLSQEASELNLILQKIISTMKNNETAKD